MLKGPGDGMSDSIPATIGGKRPARLADGEFVVHFDYAELKDLLRTNGPAALLPTVGN